MCGKFLWFSTFGGLSCLVKKNTRCILTSKRLWDRSAGLCFRHKLRKHGLDVICMKWVHNSLIKCSQKYLSVVFCQTKRASQAGSCRGQSLAQFYSILQFWFECRITEYPCKICNYYQARKVASTWEDSTGSQNGFHKFKQKSSQIQLSVNWSGFHIAMAHKERILEIQVKFQSTWTVNDCQVIYAQC